MKSNVKITSIFGIFCILLYISSIDEISGDHVVGEAVIHQNNFEIIMKSSPPGLDLQGSGFYEEGTWLKTETVLLEWGAYDFVGWTVDGQWVDGNPYTVLVDKDHVVTAMYSFHPVKKQTSTPTTLTKYDLTIISQFGKTVGVGTYVDGTTVDFSVSQQFVNDEIYDGIRYAFSGWSGGNTPSLMSNVIKINQTETITANWDKQYRLDIVDSADKTIILQTSWHDEDSVAPLITSNVNPNFENKIKRTINSWVSTGINYAEIKEPTEPITSLVMDDYYKVSIDWKNQFYIDVSSPYGTVEGSGWYDEGDVVVASINQQTYDLGLAGTRLIFNGWVGDETSSGMNIQIPLDGPKVLEGTWKKQYQLTVNSDYGFPTGSGWYNEGDLASFGTNQPRDPTGIWNQQIFQGWIGDSESISYTGTVLMTGPKIVNAVWEVDYSIAIFNVALISIAALGGLIVYKKSKKGFGTNKSSKTDNDEIVTTKPKQSLFSSLGEIFNSKTTKTVEQENNEQPSKIINQNQPERIIPTVIASETSPQRSGQLEDSIKNMDEKRIQSTTPEDLKNNVKNIEFQKNDLLDKTKQFEYGLMEIEFEKKKIAYENKETTFELERKGGLAKLERIENEIKFTEKNLEQKSTHLEKRLAEVQLQKLTLSQKTEQLEENIAENELEKKKSMMKLENDRTEIELQKNNLSQKTKELEKKLSDVKLEKDITFQEKEQLKKNLSEVELQKKTALVELERKIHSIEFERKEFEIELQKKSNEIELQKNHLSSNSALLEKSLAEVQLQKLTLSQKTEQLEENIAENEFKKKSMMKLGNDRNEIELQKNNLSQKTKELEKTLSEVQLQKLTLSQKTKQLERSLTEVQSQKNINTDEIQKNFIALELQRKVIAQRMNDLEQTISDVQYEKMKIVSKFEKRTSEIKFEKNNIYQKTEQLEKSLDEVQLQKNNISKEKQQLEKIISEVQLQKNNLSKKTEQLEKSLVEVDLDKKKMTFELEQNLAESKFDKMKTTVTLENSLAEIELQKNNLSQKTEQLEKNLAEIKLEKKIQSKKTKYLENQILENTFEKKKIISDLKNKEAQIELEKKSNLVKLERKESEVQLQKNNLSQKTEQLETSLTEVQSHKQILNEKTLDLETKLSKVNFEKKKLSSELQRKESIIELEEKRINQKSWDLEKRIAKFTLERNIAAIELEKKKITSELQQKELRVEIEQEHLNQRKIELEKTIAAFEIEQDIQSNKIDVDKNLKSDESIKSSKFDGIISEIELSRKISDTELQRKAVVIELEKKDLAEKEKMMEKRIAGIETERKISAIQIDRIESEIKLQKKNLENKTREFGKNSQKFNSKNNFDTSSNSTSYDEFLEWSSALNDELGSTESSKKDNKILSGE